jgi:hypothetical protein
MKDLGKAFSFMFKDPSWVSKTAIAAVFMLLSVVLVGFFILLGYFLQITQRVMRKQEPALPEWDNIGVKFILGIKLSVVYLVYLIPVMIFMIPLLGLAAASGFADQSDVVGMAFGIYLFGLTLLIVPYSLVLSIATPIIVYRFAERERIGDAIDVVRVVNLFRANWQNSLIVALIALGLQSFGGIGVVVFLIGFFFTMFYAYAVSSYMSGLLYLERAREGATE